MLKNNQNFYSRYLYRFLFVGGVVAAFWVRWQYFFIERMWPDEALYCWYARQIYNNPSMIFSKEIIEFHPPLFSLLLALGQNFFPPETAYRMVSLILNMAGVVVIYFLGRRVQSPFLGLFGSLALGFNFLYLSQATHILSDGPMMLFCELLILLMARMDMSRSLKNDIYVGMAGVAVVFIKWPGIIVLPFLGLYYLWAFPQESLSRRLRLGLVPLSMVGGSILWMVIYFSFLTGKLWPNLAVLKGVYLTKPFWYYAKNFHNIIMIPQLIPFFILGFFIVLIRRRRQDKLILLWFGIFFIALSLSKEKDLRYGLLILPSSLLISGIGVEYVLDALFKTPKRNFFAKILCVVLIIAFYVQMFPRTQRFLKKGTRQFIGFKEAGAWVRRHADSSTLVMAGSARIMRYYSGMNFRKYGGRIIGIPERQKDFEKIVKNTADPIVIEVDYWERTQPQWIFPLNKERISYLEQWGFQLKKAIFRRAYYQDQPLVWLFYRGTKE